ncbi:hypothetical protein QYE76_066289 [Lolium multiflorum]|uniref:RNase H type-1 domain-containing protein n=1 Tax=Lolium multiflorum TaxID=4521 RepID=A0AAD8WBV6_LOLMU|nr:hypothetical protein QYE76_066289 [Lolium multiflorum]
MKKNGVGSSVGFGGRMKEKVDGIMNDDLCKDFTDEEISDALFQIGPLKAPGVDGFPARFYRRNWATLKEEVINVFIGNGSSSWLAIVHGLELLKKGSRRFLVSYLNSLLMVKQWPEKDVVKGKMVISHDQGFRKEPTGNNINGAKNQSWVPPDRGKVKLNVDGAYDPASADAGMVLKDSSGRMIYAAYRHLEQCRDATEAKLMAIEEGLKLALQWSNLKFSLETDCLEALELIKERTPDLSAYAFRVNVIRDLIRERNTYIAKIGRVANGVGHSLARMGRVQKRTAFWLANFPAEAVAANALDCNPSMI